MTPEPLSNTACPRFMESEKKRVQNAGQSANSASLAEEYSIPTGSVRYAATRLMEEVHQV